MDDETSRFTCRGQQLFHFIGLSTFSEYTVVRSSAVTKMSRNVRLNKVCLIGCEVMSGYYFGTRVQPGSNVAIWGMNKKGISTALGCRVKGAAIIVAVDSDEKKLENAKQFGIEELINQKELGIGYEIDRYFRRNYYNVLFDYILETTGDMKAINQALQCPKMANEKILIIGNLNERPTLDPKFPHEAVSENIRKRSTLDPNFQHTTVSTSAIMSTLVIRYLNDDLPLDKFAFCEFSLEQINQGIEHFLGQSVSSVIKMIGNEQV